MSNYNVKIAGEVVEVDIRRPSMLADFKPYFTDETASESFVPTDELRDEIRRSSAENDILAGRPIREVDKKFIEMQSLLSLAAHDFVGRGILLVHGSAVTVDGKAYLFIAPSETGKSTHTRLWLELLGERAAIINDDKQLVRLTGDVPLVYPTPWGMTKKPPECESAQLAAIISLERGDKNVINRISKAHMFIPLFKASLQGKTSEEATRIVNLQTKLLNSVRLYSMKCTPDVEAARIAAKALIKAE